MLGIPNRREPNNMRPTRHIDRCQECSPASLTNDNIRFILRGGEVKCASCGVVHKPSILGGCAFHGIETIVFLFSFLLFFGLFGVWPGLLAAFMSVFVCQLIAVRISAYLRNTIVYNVSVEADDQDRGDDQL